jgi:hypothetical protein
MRTVQKSKGRIFVDSGAHSLYTEHVIKKEHREAYDYYESDEFWKYVDEYAKWVKKNKQSIDIYVNVDVIFNPELTWKVQMYLEKTHKLKPLPVVHYGTDIKWLKKYMDNHEYIGIGGIGQEVTVSEYYKFGDDVFTTISDSKGFPTHKLHGFAVTAPTLIHRYPWYSVDSTSWVQYGRFGAILMPKTKHGKFDYSTAPIVIFVSERSTFKDVSGKHISTLSEIERAKLVKYVESKGYVMGKSEMVKVPLDYKPENNESVAKKHKDHKIIERVLTPGVSNDNIMRDTFNALYFVDLSKSVPEWPWAFKHRKVGFI